MENKKQSEIVAVQDLIQLLDLSRVVFTMDALHCHGFDSITKALDYMSNNLPLLLSFCD